MAVWFGCVLGKFKKGYTAIGEVKPHSKTSFANQNSRGTDRHQEKALKELLGEPEEVVVDPSDDALKSRVRGGSRMGPPRQPSSGSAKASATASAGTKPAAFQAATRADVVLPSTSDPTEGTSEKSPRQGPKGKTKFPRLMINYFIVTYRDWHGCRTCSIPRFLPRG